MYSIKMYYMFKMVELVDFDNLLVPKKFTSNDINIVQTTQCNEYSLQGFYFAWLRYR